MKNILYITPYYTNYAVSLFENLNKIKNINLTVLYPLDKKRIKIKSEYKKIYSKNYKIFTSLEDKYEICFYKIDNLKEILLKTKPDIIVVHNRHILNFILNSKIKNICNLLKTKIYYRTIPFLVPDKNTHLINLYLGNNKFKKLILSSHLLDIFVHSYYKFIFSKIDHFLTYTNRGKNIISSYGVKKKNITVTYNSPDTIKLDLIEKKIKNKKKIYDIIFCGRLDSWKKVDLLVDAINEVADLNLKCLIIGSGPEKNKLKKKINKLNLKKNFIFKGKIIKQKEIYTYFKMSKFFVLPGLGGLAINEAMHASLPIILSKADGTEKHLVKNNINGLYFKFNDSKDLAKKIKKIYKNKKLISKMGKNSKNILKKININTVIKNFEKAFNK